jgi:hypothetical protein
MEASIILVLSVLAKLTEQSAIVQTWASSYAVAPTLNLAQSAARTANSSNCLSREIEALVASSGDLSVTEAIRCQRLHQEDRVAALD